MQVYTRITTQQTPTTNQAIIEQYQQLLAEDKAKQTHWFEGRFENTYIDKALLTSTHELFEEILTAAKKILQTDRAIRMGFWFNEMHPNHRTVAHTHEDNDELLSGVYYLTVPANSGDLVLGKGQQQVQLSPKAGECIFFAPDLIHEVLPNESTEMRLSIGMNFGYVDSIDRI